MLETVKAYCIVGESVDLGMVIETILNEGNLQLRVIEWGRHCIILGFKAMIASDMHKMRFAL
jgi:hypothetical protein